MEIIYKRDAANSLAVACKLKDFLIKKQLIEDNDIKLLKL
jgi:hypothetical protein